jgi:hypothetical protein
MASSESYRLLTWRCPNESRSNDKDTAKLEPGTEAAGWDLGGQAELTSPH